MNTTKKVPLTPESALESMVEPRRVTLHLSLRTVADRAGMSEGTWRQLVNGGVLAQGSWVSRFPRRDQVLAMAQAVGILDDVAEAIDASADEVSAVYIRRQNLMDPAEREIMEMKELSPREKLHLMDRLEALRAEYNG